MSVTRIQVLRADASEGRLTEEIASFVKGMLLRGDKQSDIAACFGINGGRISEINTGQHFGDVAAAKEESLPPRGPYPSPFELWRTKHEMWRVRVALEEAEDAIEKAMVAVRKAEGR